MNRSMNFLQHAVHTYFVIDVYWLQQLPVPLYDNTSFAIGSILNASF